MSLLAPLFLLGGLAIALPIWLHRLKTQSSTRQPFSSAMLLETTEEQVHVQKQLKYWLLLAFRMAVLLLLAFAFAKPFIERPPTEALSDTGTGSTLVVLDASASMGRSGVFDQAIDLAESALADAANGAVLQVLVAGSRVRELRPPSTDAGTHTSALAGLEPEAGRMDFGQIMAAAEAVAERLPAPVELHFISDFQSSAMPAQFAEVIPANVARLIPTVAGTGMPVNWSISQLRETAEGVEVSVQNTGLPERVADVELRVNDELVGVRTVGGQGLYTVQFEAVDLQPGDNRVEVRLDTDDDLAGDNVAFLVVRNDPPQPVPVITRNPQSLAVTYLSAALEATPNAGFTSQPLVPGDFDTRVLSRSSWLIVDDLGTLDSVNADALGDYVEDGGHVLAFLGNGSTGMDRLPVSGRALAAADLGSGVSAFRRIGSVDDQHPALQNTEGWHRVRVSRSVGVDLDGDVSVLMRLDSGAPFLIEERLGDGRLLALLSAIDNQWSDLPVHPVFVSFVIEAADYLSGRTDAFGTYAAGELLSLAAAGAGQVVDPDGENLLSLAGTRDARTIRLEKAGIYAVYTAEGESLIAVNVDPRESALAPIQPDVLERWREATFTSSSGQDAALAAEAEPLKLWPWVLLLLAIVVIAESALGNVHIATRMRTAG
ncbi:MAG: BatA and WFA domain-containing protein [Pseudomonadota bacterium]